MKLDMNGLCLCEKWKAYQPISQAEIQLSVNFISQCLNDLILKSRYPVYEERAMDQMEQIASAVNNDSGFYSGSDYSWSNSDFQDTRDDLHMCGFYFKNIDQVSAMKLLKKAKVGSFLIRDSSHPNFKFTVSVKTKQGSTNIRVSYVDNLFGFDGDEEQPKDKPRFLTIIGLIDHYAKIRATQGKCLTMRGKTDRKSVKIEFIKPVKTSVSSLAHLARVKINSSIKNKDAHELSIRSLPISDSDKQFVQMYPYTI